MSRIRGKDTKPELQFRKAVWNAGARFRCHPSDVAGRPDLCHRTSRVAVFVDGCFWHGCPRHFRVPRTRARFWTEKIRRNKATRARVLRELAPDWRVFQFYECQLRDNMGTARNAVVSAILRSRVSSYV